MSKIWRVEEEQITKSGKIIGTNYTVWYKDDNGERTARRDYREGQYKAIPMTVLNFILDENNEARTRYQEFDGNTYKRTTYQQPQEAPQTATAAEAEQQPTTDEAPQEATQAAQDAATPDRQPVGVWMDDGSATDSQTARDMIHANLEYLTADDPARAEQIELLAELDRQEGRPTEA